MTGSRYCSWRESPPNSFYETVKSPLPVSFPGPCRCFLTSYRTMS